MEIEDEEGTTPAPRKRKTVTWRDEEEEDGQLVDESSPVEYRQPQTACVVCGNEAQMRENMQASVLTRVTTVVYQITGEVVSMEGLTFCSNQCQRTYYTYTLKRDTEDIEDHRRRVFYMECLFESDAMRDKYSHLDTLEISLLCENLASAYVGENRPSIMAMAKYHSVMLSGRGLVHVAGDNRKGALGIGRDNGRMVTRMQPIKIDNVTSVYAAGNYTLLLRGDSGTLLMSGSLGGMTFGGSDDDHFTSVLNIDRIIHVACNKHIICVIRSDGSLWATQTDKDFLYFTEVTNENRDFVAVVLATIDVVALRVDGSLWSNIDHLHEAMMRTQHMPLVSIRCEPNTLLIARARNDETWVRDNDGIFHRVGDTTTNHASLNDTKQLVLRNTLPERPLSLVGDCQYETQLDKHVQSYCSSENYNSIMYRLSDGGVYALGLNRAGKLGLGMTDNIIGAPQRVHHLTPLRKIESRISSRKLKKQRCTTCGSDALFVVTGLTHYVCDSPICIDNSVYA